MDEKITNPIRGLTDMLAEMTERSVKLEADLAEANERANEWYQMWKDQAAKVDELNAKLAKEEEQHARTKKALESLLKDIDEGVLTYGTKK